MSSASTCVCCSTSRTGRRRRRRVGGEAPAGIGGCDLPLEALQRPVAAALDLGRDAGQRHDRADRFAGRR